MFNNKDEIKDVSFKEVNMDSSLRNEGNINFRSKNKFRLNRIFKFISFVTISALSGAITATYIVNTRYYELTKKGDTPMVQEKKSVIGSSGVSTNLVNKVSKEVAPSIVGIIDAGAPNTSEGQVVSSGIIFKSDGYIVTNYHLINKSNKIMVRLSYVKEVKDIEAKLIGYDIASDLAVIKIDSRNLPVAVLGNSSEIKVGDLAIAIGTSIGDESTGAVTAGVISAVDRNLKFTNDVNGQTSTFKVIQTDASINQDNSGGALCNQKGEVIGINSFKISSEYNAEGTGFAISINQAKDIVNQIMKNGKVTKPFVGIIGRNVRLNQEDFAKGVYVKKVIPESGAAKAGIKPNDIILELNGQRICSADDIGNSISGDKIGNKVWCVINRNGKIIKLQILVTENISRED
ncbi:S1C family serine protease [Clostridium felsineum]|uniref:S1C family serine protease n=1 Tax=Clostridium felsineum TaxID=36839 RepID=UPI0009D08B2E|nr:trypsin-like peptidase domain-containing protein [Clostridium felsineum]URZ14681.1 hypothetical protein CLFE_006790 [Clostridium felsineum DSM 794]